MKVLSFLGALLIVVGCTAKPDPVPRNFCSSDSDCEVGTSCDVARELCIAPRTETPYPVVLQVVTTGASAGDVVRHTLPPFELRRSEEEYDLQVPAGLPLRGTVGFVDKDQVKAVRAQVAFVPVRQRGLPVAAITTGSAAKLNEQQENLAVTLSPATTYDVAVYPLGESSLEFPPLFTSIDTSDMASADSMSFMYAALDRFDGYLLDEKGTPVTGRWVRILDANKRVVSSIGIVGEKGELALSVTKGVLETKTYSFEVNLDDENAWSTTLEADSAHVDVGKNSTITIPAIPEYVRFEGTVATYRELPSPGTDLTFVSNFPVPKVPGDVGGRDFCRATLPSVTKVSCRSTRQTTTNAQGRFSALLLPGNYNVFLSPTRDSATEDGAKKGGDTTKAAFAVIETRRAGASQEGQRYVLGVGSRYEALVRTTDGRPLDNVIVRAVALGLPGLNEVSPYNRTSEAVTGRTGSFVLPVDIGYYDLVARPSESTGFPWVYVPNLAIKVAQEAPLTIAGFVMPTPLVVAGTVYREGVAQPMASVDAYALVPGLDGKQRAVSVGHTTADLEGHYTLLLANNVRVLEETAEAPNQLFDAGSE